MKSALHRVVVIPFLFCLIPAAKSQWKPDGPPNWSATEFVTVGGITYFRFTSAMNDWCERLAQYPVSRDGTNLSQAIQQEKWQDICVCNTLDCGSAPNKELVSVLGALSAGTYALTVVSTNATGFLRTNVSLFSFTVPMNSAPTLGVSANTKDSSLRIEVAGVSKVQYVLESSSNFTDWSALRTNIGAPVAFTQPNHGPQGFYRAKIVAVPTAE